MPIKSRSMEINDINYLLTEVSKNPFDHYSEKTYTLLKESLKFS